MNDLTVTEWSNHSTKASEFSRWSICVSRVCSCGRLYALVKRM